MGKDDVVQTSDLLRPRHVGMPIRRTEDPRLLTGNGEYTADRKPDRALHVAFRRSEQPHADILRIVATKARAAPGVGAVCTADAVAADYTVQMSYYLYFDPSDISIATGDSVTWVNNSGYSHTSAGMFVLTEM